MAKYAKYSVQTRTWLSGGWRTERNFTGLASAKKDARAIAKGGQDSRVMDKDSGKVYIEYKAPKTNPSIKKGKWLKAKAVKFNKNGSISIKK